MILPSVSLNPLPPTCTHTHVHTHLLGAITLGTKGQKGHAVNMKTHQIHNLTVVCTCAAYGRDVEEMGGEYSRVHGCS